MKGAVKSFLVLVPGRMELKRNSVSFNYSNMKTYFYQSLIVLSLCSCTADLSEDVPSNIHETAGSAAKKSNDLAANPDNPYDYAGKICNDLLDEYHLAPSSSKTLSDVKLLVDSLAFAKYGFTALLPVNYEVISHSTIENAISNAEADFLPDLLAAGYSVQAQTYLLNIKAELALLKLADVRYSEVQSYLEEVEADILADSLMQGEEQALLVTVSILRYSLYNDTRRKRRDRDWEWSTGNLTATSTAAIDNVPDAIISGIVSKLYKP